MAPVSRQPSCHHPHFSKSPALTDQREERANSISRADGYPILTQVNRTRLGSCKITFCLPKGTVRLRVPSGDCNFISKVREQLKAQLKTSSVDTQGRENLCPRCFVQVSGFPRRCRHCRQGFKSAKKAGWLTVLFPGLGNFYLKNRLSGFLEFSGALMVWMAYFLGGAVDGGLRPGRAFDVSSFPLGRTAGCFLARDRRHDHLPRGEEGSLSFGRGRQRLGASVSALREGRMALEGKRGRKSGCLR